VSTFAGSTKGYEDGKPMDAKFQSPFGLVYNPNDQCVYVADKHNFAVRKINPEGVTSTFAKMGTSRVFGSICTGGPLRMALYLEENALLVTDPDNRVIRKISSKGIVSIVAGNGAKGHEDGVVTEASFTSPVGIAVDQRNGDIYVSDLHTIRKISQPASIKVTSSQESGNLPLFVWLNVITFCKPSTLAQLSQVCSSLYSPAQLQMGVHVVTVAGGIYAGMVDGPAETSHFFNPSGLCFSERDECLYIADFGNHMIRKLDTNTGIVSTVAGTSCGYLNGGGDVAKFVRPSNVALAANDRSLLVADFGDHRIRHIKLPTEGQICMVETLAGCGKAGYQDGAALECKFHTPHSLCVDHSNNVCYISDYDNFRIRKLSLATASALTSV